MKPLISSDYAGTHIAVSSDGFRLICMQGHPEYDTISLLKEYQREVTNFQNGQRPEPPPMPENYFKSEAIEILSHYAQNKNLTTSERQQLNNEICPLLENTWTDSARSIIACWIGLVYQITHADRNKQFMEGINPENPLSLIT